MAYLGKEQATLDRFLFMPCARQLWECTKKQSRASLIICAQ
jgi:hypothetical protein